MVLWGIILSLRAYSFKVLGFTGFRVWSFGVGDLVASKLGHLNEG